MVDCARFCLTTRTERWPKGDSLFQVCVHSLPSILRQLSIFVEYREKKNAVFFSYFSFDSSLTVIKGHKELYERTVVLYLLSGSATDRHV